MAGATKLMTAGGGGVNITPASSIASDVTVQVPSVNGDLVNTGSTGQVSPGMLSTGRPDWDTSGNLKFNSGYGSVATAYGCRAWVNFNGTGTVAIRASGNVSSITDNGTGDYTVNFSTSMPDANYSTSFSAERAGGRVPLLQPSTYSTTAVRLNIVDIANNALNGDSSICCVSIFR